MRTLDKAFAALLGTQPDDQSRQHLYRVRDALNLREDDALWLLLMVLGHYETLYGQIPALIAKETASLLAGVRQAAEAEMKATSEKTKQDLVAAVARTAEKAASRTTRGNLLKWGAACISATTIGLISMGWWSHRHGTIEGHARGWAEAHRMATDERAAASWANTPEGRLGYGLAKAGSLRELATCSGRGWQRKGELCFPKPLGGSIYGWRLPR